MYLPLLWPSYSPKDLLTFCYVFSEKGQNVMVSIYYTVVNNPLHTLLCILYGCFHQGRVLLAQKLVFKIDRFCRVPLPRMSDRQNWVSMNSQKFKRWIMSKLIRTAASFLQIIWSPAKCRNHNFLHIPLPPTPFYNTIVFCPHTYLEPHQCFNFYFNCEPNYGNSRAKRKCIEPAIVLIQLFSLPSWFPHSSSIISFSV